jgi:hypothetical protein
LQLLLQILRVSVHLLLAHFLLLSALLFLELGLLKDFIRAVRAL